jgi:hypothetical protein
MEFLAKCIVVGKHGLWSDCSLKEYLVVLPYLKGSSLYFCVVYGVNFLVIMKLRVCSQE